MTCINYNNFFKKLLLISIVFIFSACDSRFLLSPHGKIAIEQSSLILISFFMMLLIIIPVVFMTIYFSLKYRSSNTNQIYSPDWCDSKKIEVVVWVVPILIISCLAFLSFRYSHILEPKKSILSNYKPIKIDVIALDWKWLFIYPDYHIATINEIVFPINRPVIFQITSCSVMNSFFIPSLGSQIYAMPGMITKLNLIANDLGKYKGISSNYSGRGFSDMKFTAITVLKNNTFLKWVETVKYSPKKLNKTNIFNIISLSDENHPVEYFSDVTRNLFYDVINMTFHTEKYPFIRI